MRLLVTGAAGMLGTDVAAAAGRAGHEVLALARADLDVLDAPAVRRALADARPDAVVHCAAYTNVDGAEADEAAATVLNGGAAGHVAGAAHAVGAFTVHVSSDYVFDGSASEPYLESSPTAPLGAYGRSKLAGEHAVAAAAPGAHAIVRTAWLFGAHGPNFVATMLRLAGERDALSVVDDQVGCPTFTGHLAPALVCLAEARAAGIHHVAGGGACSWYDLAAATFAARGVEVELARGRTADLGRPAPRPAYSVLRTERPDTPVLESWETGLHAYLEETVTA
ncbi:MAG: dTDP-4-dehydrorhamnose reductase [Solirubrobacteraceae bacterium]